MKKQLHLTLTILINLIILLAIGLSGCSSQTTATPAFTPIPPTPEMTATPTVIPGRIVLFDPNGIAGSVMTTMLGDFASSNTLGFETWTALSGNFEGVKVIVIFGSFDNLQDVAAAAPQTQFVVSSQSITPGANISTISANPVHLTFMAGYLAAMTSQDWRSGALLVDDARLGLADAFYNGGQYLCGLCTPQFTPLLYYPQVYMLTGSSDQAAWAAQATALLNETAINSIYIDRGGDTPAVLDQFANARIYGSDPTSPNLARYTAILGADVTTALQAALPDLLAGSGGKTITGPVSLLVINNPDVITPAKQARFNEISQALVDNKIIPLSIP